MSPDDVPPAPLLRPAQGAWDKLPKQPRSSPAQHTRSKDKARLAHPESAQRHSQAAAAAASSSSSSSAAPAAAPAAPAAPANDHYRYDRSPPRYPYYPPRYPDPAQYPPPPRWPPAHDEPVVLLMEDARYAGPEPDYQLAEVAVHLRPGDDASCWADGEEVIKALQATPSRLEGPAKVFARRGKYRQCFVRFAADGAMECQPSSLLVSRDKTIELIIEPNPEGLHPAHPHAQYRAPYDYGPAAAAYPAPHYYPPPPPPPPGATANGKRAAPAPAPDELPAAKRARGATSASAGAAGAGPAPTRASSPDSAASPAPPAAAKAPKEVVNAAIVAHLRAHIQPEDGYLEFAASKGRLLPIPDLLKGYRFATRIVNAWANRKTPPSAAGCAGKRITKNHVLQALFRQTSWGSDCEQTLQLADRYGPGGAREDARVVEILSGGRMLPEKAAGDKGRSQGSVALLDFLKDVDREQKAREEEAERASLSAGGGGAGGGAGGGGGAGAAGGGAAGGAGGTTASGAGAGAGAGARRGSASASAGPGGAHENGE